MGHLNYFEPFDRQNSDWENPLTRALLVTLKHSPLAVNLFYDLVTRKYLEKCNEKIAIPNYSTFELGNIAFETQIGSLRGFESELLLSVYITDDLTKNDIFQNDIIVKNNDRRPVYDGVVKFSDEITMFIENKPNAVDAWEEQMFPNLNDLENEPILLKTPALLEWKDVINIFNNMISSGVVSYAEKIIISDFLEYCFKNFPHLNPYDRLDLCNGNKDLVLRRITNIIEENIKDGIGYNLHRGWGCPSIEIGHPSIRMVGIVYNQLTDDDYELEINLIFGDTISQSRNFYGKNINYSKIHQLENNDYTLDSRFHISHMQKGLIWFKINKNKIKDYYDYWLSNLDSIKQYSREEMQLKLKELQKLELVKIDNDLINEKIWRHSYQKLNLCPSFAVLYRIKGSDASTLDKNDKLASLIREKIDEGLSILDDPIELFKPI